MRAMQGLDIEIKFQFLKSPPTQSLTVAKIATVSSLQLRFHAEKGFKLKKSGRVHERLQMKIRIRTSLINKDSCLMNSEKIAFV